MFDLLGGGLGCINGITSQAPLMMQSSLSPLVFGTNRESGPEACRSAFLYLPQDKWSCLGRRIDFKRDELLRPPQGSRLE